VKSIPAQPDSLDSASSAEVNSSLQRTPAFERVCAWEVAFSILERNPLVAPSSWSWRQQ
jgi:hypothetical protein